MAMMVLGASTLPQVSACRWEDTTGRQRERSDERALTSASYRIIVVPLVGAETLAAVDRCHPSR